jgi:hypothetical protein
VRTAVDAIAEELPTRTQDAAAGLEFDGEFWNSKGSG